MSQSLSSSSSFSGTPSWSLVAPTLLAAAVAPLLLAAAVAPLSAAELTLEEQRMDAARGLTVMGSQVLLEEADSEVALDEVRLDFLSDGSTRLRIQTDLEPGESRHFVYSVDKETGTYSTIAVPESYIRSVEGQMQREGDSAGGSSGGATADPNSPLVLDREVAELGPPGGYSSCDFQAHGTITHYDPIFIPLAGTTSTLRWRHDYGSNCLSRLWTNRTCWAAAVTPLGTHWFIQSCSSLDRNLSLQHLQKTTNAFYYNWDFGFDTKKTTVNHYIQIDARTGVSTFVMGDNDWGEGSSLIFGVGSVTFTDLSCRP